MTKELKKKEEMSALTRYLVKLVGDPKASFTINDDQIIKGKLITYEFVNLHSELRLTIKCDEFVPKIGT